MDYIVAMQRLAKYRAELREANMENHTPYTIIANMKQKLDAIANIDKYNVANWAGSVSNQNDEAAVLRSFGQECAQQLAMKTSNYKSQMADIKCKAQKELDKSNKKSGAATVFKVYLGLVLGFLSLSLIVMSMSIDMPGALLGGLAIGALLIFMIGKKSKPDEEILTSLANEAKQLSYQYYSYALSILTPEYDKMEANRLAKIEANARNVKEIVGERVFFLFENTPYMQQEYFIQLGMTATTEDDFNAIAQECLKADKSEQLVNLQNMVNRETRDSITQSLEKLNRTTQKMHEDAEFRAKQQAAHNAEIAKQNQRNLANQAKALDELKKARKDADDREYRMRHQ